MADQDVLMDYERITDVAGTFDMVGQEFNALLGPLASVGQQLSGQSFVGLTGTAANQQLEQIQARISAIVQRCVEMHADILQAIQSYQTGDSQGAELFQ